ncbi:hypothetical protein RHGRI_006379 [Rhododendron griersonianum]|uniref:Uncharacterized protein n=1 Tax=Rhododendron griersonianum TaxID=479676 RepID=A0AAV6KSX1_9ERIC|nr:hypothetical protein RHGRI_006379 [Rhododendron griersonianum]
MGERERDTIRSLSSPLPSLSLQTTATSGGICYRRRTAGVALLSEFALFSHVGAVNGCFPASGEDWLRKSAACWSEKCWSAIC